MVEQSIQKLPPILYAEASVHSVGGVSLFRTSDLITNENVNSFYSEPQLIKLAVDKLRSEGFNVLAQGQITITISAAPEVYERVFRTKIIPKERSVIKGGGYETTATFFDAPDTDIRGLIDTSQCSLANVLEGVAINEPLFYFDSAFPPSKAYWHLEVPEDVSRGLNAHLAHAQGFTGRGVRVAMVDSGWYRHPFFVHRGYGAKVVLAPGTSHPELDDIGHGTGESANIFAVAPDVDFTMVKDTTVKGASVNSVGAFRTAVSLRPNIISCSWGSTQQYPSLSAFDKVLAAVISNAVKHKIIVIFSAGNGQWGFPAQHPDVIAAGGVYMHPDGTLEASDYASGFTSNIYQERHVPDVCGLVGKQPRSTYIMLPVQPGCLIDSIFGLPGVKHPDGDETQANDGWAAFSGTSAAAPQLAGICALMKQAYPELSPRQARDILQQTARDVTKGSCNLRTGGHSASPGFDLATGSGLADAFQSTLEARRQTETTKQQKLDYQPNLLSQIISVEVMMDSKLKKRWYEILWQFDKVLQNEIKNHEIPEVELRISEANFVPRSPVTRAAASLRERLDKKNEDIGLRVSAAEGLLKLGRYQEAVLEFLTSPDTFKQIDNSPYQDEQKSDLRERVIKALGEIASDVTDTGLFSDTQPECPDGFKWCRDRCIGVNDKCEPTVRFDSSNS